ncbi:NUDIX hydrolase [Armatimonas sp.]|uniref:NUDIX hydrolase n=1 Tax=Armatimonas sp. TaxID=1872638 RepID=UPI00374CA176
MSGEPGGFRHIVAVSGLVSDPLTGKVLLIRSPRRGWEFPGGQVEEDESLTEALVREVQEETGVTVEVTELVGIYSNTRSHIVMFGFLCEWLNGELTTSPESLEVAWVERGKALERITNPAIHDRLRDMLNFSGTVVYRAYVRTQETYLIQEEREL